MRKLGTSITVSLIPRRRVARPAWAAAFAIAGLLATPLDARGEQAMIVLDASGSMWGRVDGRTKIEIAREVLGEVLSGAPPGLSVGLMAYGHRRKGSCADIEILSEPRSGAAGPIADAAAALKPKGKTPLTAAVRRAAEHLRYTEEKATVILITDGLETCEADPCALGAELERSGVDFTAHVVGFGLSAREGEQIACLAEATGGRYFPAHGAATLAGALRDSVSSPVKTAAGEDDVPAAAAPEVAVSAPGEVEVGQPFEASWQGADGPGDRVQLFDPAAAGGAGREVAGSRIGESDVAESRVTLVAPVRPGRYQLRYLHGEDRLVAASTWVVVVKAPAALHAPANVSLGGRFEVAWEGPGGKLDRIEIVDPAADRNALALTTVRVATGDPGARTVELVAPAEPGFYRLRYWHSDSRTVLAAREIEVLDAEVSILAPDTVAMGERFSVDWSGPGARLDAVQIAGPGADRIVTSRRLVLGDFDRRRVDLDAPVEPGSYELRYWNGDNREVLAVRPINVEPVEVALEVTDPVSAGAPFTVVWTGPGGRRDSVEIVSLENGRVISGQRVVNGDLAGRSVRLTAPEAAGEYLLRYFNARQRAVLAERPLTVR